jgi:hypothetical protein
MKAFKHLNLSKISGSHAGSHWSWPPDKLAALPIALWRMNKEIA